MGFLLFWFLKFTTVFLWLKSKNVRLVHKDEFLFDLLGFGGKQRLPERKSSKGMPFEKCLNRPVCQEYCFQNGVMNESLMKEEKADCSDEMIKDKDPKEKALRETNHQATKFLKHIE